MKKEKQKKSPCEQLLHEDLEDKELQRKYESFKIEEESLLKSYNEIVAEYNNSQEEFENLKNIILHNLIQGYTIPEQIEKFKLRKEKLDIFLKDIKEIDKQVKEIQTLIESYKQSSQDRFYYHWRYHKACGETDLTWFQWINKFDKVII